MELRQLTYFLTISETKNFTRAAEKLFISQPALTKQINALESELDVKLFDRTNKSVALTAAGRTFFLHATQVINEVNSTISHVNQLKNEEDARIHLAIHPLLADWVLAPTLAFFQKHYTGRPVFVTICGFEEQKKLLTANKVNATLTIDFDREDLKEFVLMQFPMVVSYSNAADNQNAQWVIPGDCGYLSQVLADEVNPGGQNSVYISKGQMKNYLDSATFNVVYPAFATPNCDAKYLKPLLSQAHIYLMGDKSVCAKFSPCIVSALSC